MPVPPLPTTDQAIARVLSWLPGQPAPTPPVQPHNSRKLLTLLLQAGTAQAVTSALAPTPSFAAKLLLQVNAAHAAAHYAGRLLAWQQFGAAQGQPAPGVLNAADMAAGLAAAQQQAPFAQRFAGQLAAGQVSPAQAGARAGMYIAGARNSGILAWLGAVPSYGLIDWALEPEAVHCVTCPQIATLDGGVRLRAAYTKSTLPTTPRAGDTQCLMFCLCWLVYMGFRSP